MDENRGFFYYTIKKGDTIYKIVNEFGGSIQQVLVANPGIQIYNLKVGQKIVVPVGKIVDTTISYTSDILATDIRSLKVVYPFLQVGEIGKSVLGKSINYIKIGTGRKEVFYNASFHANEWITTPILMNFIEQYAKAFVNNGNIYGYNAKNLYYNTTLYIVPMVNLDGVDLVTGAIQNVDNAYKNAEKIANNFPDIPFPNGWKANIEGVDLKNYQPVCKVLQRLNYKTLLLFVFPINLLYFYL